MNGNKQDMKNIHFFKMSGSGNDFIIIDNRENLIEDKGLASFITKVCARRMSVGADGFILIENCDSADFKWQFFNSDGSRAEMCGNGARCAAMFACINKIAKPDMSFLTDAGIVHAQVTDGRVKVNMMDPTYCKYDYQIPLKKGPITVSSLNTGVPHVVIITDDIEGADVDGTGREIRFHENYAPAGTNVNFISCVSNSTIHIRTYERGVEGETLACGTGSIASALVAACKYKVESPIDVVTRSKGVLTIHFKQDNGRFYDIYLEGDARVIYKGELGKDAWQY
uniref:Diaminopimelate epimerase n=2 Tax=Desulfobacterium TaxID=2295 RepID=E1YBK7_9BACT|nr:Diaminopimelate epimerase [uncultured Desulfobacterium sp.]